MPNKYQKALSKLENIICELSCELKKDYELYTRDTGYEEHIEILQELVDKETDKETSMKPVYKFIKEPYEHRWHCPKCNEIIRTIIYQDVEEDTGKLNYCPECGTHIDWSDE